MISIYAHRQAVPIIEDDDCLMKRFVRWERIEQWMDAALDRELYLVVSPPDPGSKDCWDRQAAALLEHPPMQGRGAEFAGCSGCASDAPH